MTHSSITIVAHYYGRERVLMGRGYWHNSKVSKASFSSGEPVVTWHGEVSVWSDGERTARGDCRDMWDATHGLTEDEAELAYVEAERKVRQGRLL